MLIISNELYDKTDFPLLSDKFIEFCVVFVVNCRKLAFNFFFTATEIVTHFIKAGVESRSFVLTKLKRIIGSFGIVFSAIIIALSKLFTVFTNLTISSIIYRYKFVNGILCDAVCNR